MTTNEYLSVSEAFRDILDDEELSESFEQQLRSRRVVKALVSLRVSKGVTQQDVADVLDCTQSRISRIENGLDADLRMSELAAYAKACNCEVAHLFSECGKSFADQIRHAPHEVHHPSET
jgi:predicted transcriptional regulator